MVHLHGPDQALQSAAQLQALQAAACCWRLLGCHLTGPRPQFCPCAWLARGHGWIGQPPGVDHWDGRARPDQAARSAPPPRNPRVSAVSAPAACPCQPALACPVTALPHAAQALQLRHQLLRRLVRRLSSALDTSDELRVIILVDKHLRTQHFIISMKCGKLDRTF